MSVFKSLVYTWSTQIISIIKEVKLFYRLFFLPHEPIFLNMILNLFSPHKQLRESSCQATGCRLSNRQGIPVPWRQLPRACKLYPTSRFPQQPPHMPSLAFWILLDVLNLSVTACEHHTNRIETSPPPLRSFSHLPPPPDPEYSIPPADRVVWYCLAVGCQLFYDVCLGNSSVGLRECWGGEKVAVGDYHYSVYTLSDCCTHSPQVEMNYIPFSILSTSMQQSSWCAASCLWLHTYPVIQGHRLTKDGFHRLFIFNLFNHEELFPLSSAVTFLPLAL